MPRPKRTPEERKINKRARKLAYHHRNRDRLLPEMRQRNQDRRAAMTPEELEAHRAKRNAAQKRFYARHADRINAKAKEPENRAKIAAQAVIRRAADPEKNRAYHRAWAAANPEKAVAKSLRFAKRHPQRVNAQVAKRHARIKGAPRNDVTAEQRELVLAMAHGVCAYCPHYNPQCKLCPRKAHKGLTVDHITAIAVGGSNTLHNLVACCRSCNAKKRTKPVPIPVQPLLL